MRSIAMYLTGLLTTVVVASSTVAAQEGNNESAVVPGARVRFTVTDVQSPEPWSSRRLLMKGTVADLRSDSLVVRFGGGALMTVSRMAVGDLSISRGTVPGWKAHPRYTAAGATLIAANTALFMRTANHASSISGARSATFMPMVGLLTLNSMFFVRQAFRQTERWDRVGR